MVVSKLILVGGDFECHNVTMIDDKFWCLITFFLKKKFLSRCRTYNPKAWIGHQIWILHVFQIQWAQRDPTLSSPWEGHTDFKGHCMHHATQQRDYKLKKASKKKWMKERKTRRLLRQKAKGWPKVKKESCLCVKATLSLSFIGKFFD